jgi:hypothetical protein
MPVTTRGGNGWTVLLVWSKQCPKALEPAEVFSLGQLDMNKFKDVTSTEEVVEDWTTKVLLAIIADI